MRLFSSTVRERLSRLEEAHAEALKRVEVAEADAATSRESLAELARTIAVSPMLGAPTHPGTPVSSRYPLYSWDTPITWSTPQPPTRRPQSIVNLAQLRQLAETYDILRSCIQHLKREVSAVPLQFVMRDPDAEGPDCDRMIALAEDFFDTPGGLGGIGQRRQHFEGEIIEDL